MNTSNKRPRVKHSSSRIPQPRDPLGRFAAKKKEADSRSQASYKSSVEVAQGTSHAAVAVTSTKRVLADPAEPFSTAHTQHIGLLRRALRAMVSPLERNSFTVYALNSFQQ